MENSWLALIACLGLTHSEDLLRKKNLCISRIFTCEELMDKDKSKMELLEVIYLLDKSLDVCGLLKIRYFLELEQKGLKNGVCNSFLIFP